MAALPAFDWFHWVAQLALDSFDLGSAGLISIFPLAAQPAMVHERLGRLHSVFLGGSAHPCLLVSAQPVHISLLIAAQPALSFLLGC